MRTFQLVPFGGKAPEGAVACDGLVAGAALDASHWKGSATPDELRADTSVEMALRRWLLVFEKDDGTFEYRYEMRRWSWAETVVRPTLRPPSRNKIAQKLGDGWHVKGDLGMTGLLRSDPIAL